MVLIKSGGHTFDEKRSFIMILVKKNTRTALKIKIF